MKVILTTTGSGLDAEIDPRFGRASHFLLVDTDTLDCQAFSNPAVNARGGAGLTAAQFLAGKQAQAVVSGDFGPNAFEALTAAGISMYLYAGCRTARQALDRLQAGQLQAVGAPTQRGHI
jgi:predicted Fe-Mo cluster-binding NifX family protein